MEVKEDTFRVKTYECQSDGTIKANSLMQHLQEVAAIHAEQLGVGHSQLNEMDTYWVLSNIRLEITKLPRWQEDVTIKTWPSGYTRLIAMREFVGKDQHDSELFRASSEWMILDKKSGRPKNLIRLNLSLPKSGPRTMPGPLSRLEPQTGYSQVDRLRVPYSAIDLNGHVNNTEYVRWAIDALRRKFKLEANIRLIHTTYLSEVFEGDELVLLVSSDRSGCFRLLGKKPEGGNNVYLMEAGYDVVP